MPLLILIAQCRQGIIFKTDSKHLKLISQLYDGCQETFFHYCDFLTSAYDDAKYAARPAADCPPRHPHARKSYFVEGLASAMTRILDPGSCAKCQPLTL